jgi:hypothetical protein
MKRVLFVLPFVVFFSASTSNASIDKMTLEEMLNPAPRVRVNPAETCEDFSGYWSGQCVGAGGHVQAETLAIDQKGCGLVTFKSDKGNLPLAIGGQGNFSGAVPSCEHCDGKPATFSLTAESHWDTYKKVLTFQVAALGRPLTTDGDAKGYYVKKKMQIVDYKLVVDVFEMTTEKKVKFCSFTKQQ